MKKTALLLIFLAAMLNSSSTIHPALPRSNRDYALFFAVNDLELSFSDVAAIAKDLIGFRLTKSK